MLRAEASWIRTRLQELPDSAFPLINLGSSTSEFRQNEQPWIDAEVFLPLRDRGAATIHVDIKPAEGVDVVADLNRPDGVQQLRDLPFNSILCSNLLEHLADPRAGLRALVDVTSPGNHVIITGPLAFPPHADPIDNGFRPRPDEVVGLLGEAMKCRRADIVTDRLMFDLYAEEARHGRPAIAWSLLQPWKRPDTWKTLARWSFRRARAFAVMLERC